MPNRTNCFRGNIARYSRQLNFRLLNHPEALENLGQEQSRHTSTTASTLYDDAVANATNLTGEPNMIALAARDPTVATNLYEAGYTDIPVDRPNAKRIDPTHVRQSASRSTAGEVGTGERPVQGTPSFSHPVFECGKRPLSGPEAPPDKGGSVGNRSGTRTRLPTAGNGLIRCLRDSPTCPPSRIVSQAMCLRPPTCDFPRAGGS